VIDLGDNRWLVETVSELPNMRHADELFLDVETRRGFDHKSYGGLYPWKGDAICGVSVSRDDDPNIYYIPVRHTNSTNIPEVDFRLWLKGTISTAKKWINHNILIDAVFCYFEGAEFQHEIVDTLTLAKIHDSDRMGHGLKDLCRDWTDFDIQEDIIKDLLKQMGTKSYGDLPSDILGGYACNDIKGNRKLYRYMQETCETPEIWEHEIALTPVLFDAEIRGLRVNHLLTRMDRLQCEARTIDLETEIAEIAEREFTNSNAWYRETLLGRFNYPVLVTKFEKGKDTGKPTFDKDALKVYAAHPITLGSPKLKRLMEAIIEYRKDAQHLGLFVRPFMEFMDDNQHIHPTYNQLVRTGRMSCKRPNAQQQNKRSKRLIIPRPGYGFMSCDYSQIEFRLIIHYIKDLAAIKAYNDDPWTDFHQWVADMIHIQRGPGKTLNFCIGYGAGKHKVESELAANPDIIEEIGYKVNEMIAAGELRLDQRNEVFKTMCGKRAAEVYDEYHETLPGIKETSWGMQNKARSRGYVFNAYGRRRHLPKKFAHKAFNSVVQGTAMDIIKERMVALSRRNDPQMEEWGIDIVANVHDEILFEVPLELLWSSEVHQYVLNKLESPKVKFRVPIKCGLGISTQNWAVAAGDDILEIDGRKQGALVNSKTMAKVAG
jgi:DNA polymerase I